MNQDPRLTLLKDGVADVALEGVVAAEHYVAPTLHTVCTSRAPIRKAPAPDAEQLDEAIFGEAVRVLTTGGEFGFGQAVRNGYCGYFALKDLGTPAPAPTHRVTALSTHVFSGPSIKIAPIRVLYQNSLVRLGGEAAGSLVPLADGGFVPASHLAPIGRDFETDPAAVAERYLGTPYLWGGRTVAGLDCSGLVEQALYACGRACPRDTDQQAAGLGAALTIGDDLKGLTRTDLVFWRGHVGMMLDGEHLLHANAHHMAVAIEPLSEAVKRIEAAASGRPIAFKRIA